MSTDPNATQSALGNAQTTAQTHTGRSSAPRAPARKKAARSARHAPDGLGRRSAMNALKLGIFSDAGMPWEDPAAREKIVKALRQEWQACTATGELLVQQLASCTMQLARISHAISSLSNNWSSDWQYRHAYRKCVSHLLTHEGAPPEWAYTDEQEPRARAHRLMLVERQLVLLHEHPTPERKLYAHRQLPDLWEHLTGSIAVNPFSRDIMELIAQRVSTDSPEQDVVQYLQDFRRAHWFSLLYARHGGQLDAARDYVRSTATLDLHSREHWQKTSSRLHAQIERIHLQLLAMRRQRQEASLPVLCDQHSAASPGRG